MKAWHALLHAVPGPGRTTRSHAAHMCSWLSCSHALRTALPEHVLPCPHAPQVQPQALGALVRQQPHVLTTCTAKVRVGCECP